MKNRLVQTVKALVENPEQVQINEIESAQWIILELSVAKNDMGKIIGKQGKIVHAIMALVSATFGKSGKRIVLGIADAEGLT
jgi:predicted RNA-binding protein YlqC (UPF0109 family)